jgi:hypothetical protein
MSYPLTAEQARLADLEDQAALTLHLADKAAGRPGVSQDEVDAALDRIDGQALS